MGSMVPGRDRWSTPPLTFTFDLHRWNCFQRQGEHTSCGGIWHSKGAPSWGIPGALTHPFLTWRPTESSE